MVNKCHRIMKEKNVIAQILFDECTGCGVCSEICPKRCISMKPLGDAGFFHPVIDDSVCVDCGRCLSVCPLKKTAKYEAKRVYAAYGKDKKLLKRSNSGGVFSTIAVDLLEQGAYVCGAAFSKDLKVEHVIISDVDDLCKLQGSKYVQSNAFQCYPKIKELLDDCKVVLFSGTGCQIAGLKNFLKKEYDNLLTIEVVCHGVPSPMLFNRYLEWLGDKTKGEVSEYKFRSKDLRPTGEHSQFYYVVNGSKYIGQSYEDPYYGSFLVGVTLRESCYRCHFKGKERVGDLTIGDFWGIEKSHPSFSTKNGSCVVLINTDAGVNLFEKIKGELVYTISNYKEASLRNPSLDKSPTLSIRKINYASEELFDKELKPRLSLKNKIKNRLPWQVKWFLKRIL